jgi:hypothetical protein
MNITHNEHKLYYQTIENYIKDNFSDLFNLGDEVIKKCIISDSLWVMYLYTDTPIGYYVYISDTFEDLLIQSNKI